MFLRLCIIGCSTFLAYDLVRSPLLPRLAYSLGGGPVLIGLIVSMSTTTGILTKWLFGGLSDEWGRRRLLLCACTVAALWPLTYLWIHDVRWLIPVRLVHGFVTAIIAPVMRAAVSDHVPAQTRGAQLGTYAAAAQIGMMCGRWGGGLLLFYGGFRYPLFAASVAGVAGLWCVWTWPREHRRMDRHAVSWATRWQQVLAGFHDSRRSTVIMVLSGVESSVFFARGIMEAFIPIYAIEVAGLHDGHVGTLFGLQLLAMVICKPMAGRWSDRWGRWPLICVGLMISACFMWLLPRTTSVYMLAGLLLGLSLGIALVSAPSMACISDVAKGRYGTAHGVFGTLVDIGHASGPCIGGLLIARYGYRAAFAVVAYGLAVLTLGVLWKGRQWMQG